MSTLVKLTYFKDTGKYYSSGEYISQMDHTYQIYDEVKAMLSAGNLPGLVQGAKEFFVLVQPFEEPPHLLMPDGVSTPQGTSYNQLNEQERTAFLCDCIITAVEGGIGYWAVILKYHHKEGEAGTNSAYDTLEAWASIRDREEFQIHEITVETIKQGLEKFHDLNFDVRSDIREAVLLADATNGVHGDIDAEGADCIVQAALFGEIVYS